MKKSSKKRRKRKNRSTLSLCMIVKNEESYLPDCLKSVQSLVDEMIVVDTGSADRTIQIAKSFGAKVIHHPWADDFAEARNVSLQHAGCDWILVLDADEVIAPEDLPEIKKLLKNKNISGYRLLQYNYQAKTNVANWQAVESRLPQARGSTGYIPSPLVRLFKRSKDIYFSGKVHEIVDYSIQKKQGDILDTDIPIHHYGKMAGGARKKRKQQLYMSLGKKKLKDAPYDFRALYDLGTQYVELEMYDEAREVLQKAVKLEPENAMVLFSLGVCLAAMNENQFAGECYDAVIRHDPGHVGAYNNLAALLEKDGKFDEVEALYRQAIIHNSNHYIVRYNLATFMKNRGRYDEAIAEYQKVLSIEPKMFEAHFSLGIVWYKKGCHREASGSFKRALEIDPLHEEARKNLEALEHMDRSSNKNQ